MKKIALAGIVVLVLLAGVFVAWDAVSAQAPTPQAGPFGQGGRMGGRMMGGMMNQTGTHGWMHETMVKVFAEKLDLTVDELESRLDKGETMYTIAQEKGLSVEDFQTLMTDARNQALDQAVADGTMTKEQADWMKSRGMGRMGGQGYGTQGCPGMNGGGRMGPRWQQPNTAPQG